MKNVCLLLYIAVYFFLCFATNDIQQLRIKESVGLKHKKVYKVLSFEPLHVIFDGFDVKTLGCVIKNETSIFLPGKHRLVNYNNGTAVLQTPGLNGKLETSFNCSVTNTNSVITNVEFCIKTVNRISSAVYDKLLQFELEETPEYEGITKYVCNEGEIVDLTCSKSLNDGSLKLRYYDQNGTKMVESDEVRSKDPLNFRLLVKAENNRSYVDCTHVTDESHNRREFPYRVIFIIKDKSPNNNAFIITINGMELQLNRDGVYKSYYYFKYNYKFIYSDILNITCEKNDKRIVSKIHTSLMLNPRMANPLSRDESMDFKQERSLYNPDVQLYLVETKNLDGAIMIFRLMALNTEMGYCALIQFYMDDHDGPAILGLSQSNIIYQYNKSATHWFIHYQYAVDEVLRLTCVTKIISFLEWIYGENIESPVLLNKKYETSYISFNFSIHTETNEAITCETANIRRGIRRITIVLHNMIPDVPTLENCNNLKVNNETVIPKIIPERQSKTLEIIAIIVGVLLVVVCAFCCWRLKKRTRGKQFSRSAGEDYDRVDELTEQTEGHKYENIVYNDNTHPNALNANQESSTPIRALAPPPRSTLPPKNTRFQIPPRGCISHREMEQCRCSSNECTDIQNEYDYAYGVKKQCPCVAPSKRATRKPLRQNGGAVVPHRVPAHQ